MSETPCQPSQQENGHLVTDPADIATETATSNPEQDTTASKREEVSQFSPHARSAEGLGAMNSTETAPNATQSADSGAPATVTLAEATPPENGVSGATGIEAQVCADIAKRQRRGIAKYGKTVMANDLPFLAWLTHFYEELLDAAVYARRIIHEHENQNHSSAAGVLPNNSGTVRIPRKPGGGRKPLVCPSCGSVKSIGSSMKDGVPIKRCRVCGHVHKSYPHLANAAKAAP